VKDSLAVCPDSDVKTMTDYLDRNFATLCTGAKVSDWIRTCNSIIILVLHNNIRVKHMTPVVLVLHG